MEVYCVNFHGNRTREGYWTAGVFSDRAKADRVCTWLNELMRLHQLWRMERGSLGDKIRNKRWETLEKMAEIVGQDGYYVVVAEQVFDTTAYWMAWHATKNYQGHADWPDTADIERALQEHDPSCAEAQKAQQLRLF